MEFLVLPLLLLVGLLTTLDGGDEDAGSGEEPNDNDTLAGSGTDRIFGGEGDDLLTVTEGATGLGGVGNDTITATGEASGYGLEGDDWLLGWENATIKGGEGNDTVDLGDEALGLGGAGDDVIDHDGSGEAYGDAGNDRITLSGLGAVAYGGSGVDHLYPQDANTADGGDGNDVFHVGDPAAPGGSVTLTGGADSDLFLISDVTRGVGEQSGGWFSTSATITDFDPSTDALGLVVDPQWVGDLAIRSSFNSTTGMTQVTVFEPNPYQNTVADLYLQGEHDLDLSQIRFFAADDMSELEFSRTGTSGDDVLISAGHPTGSSEAFGLGGDDSIVLTHGTAYGGAGEDTLTGDGTLHGDDGNDRMTGGGTLVGGAGNDDLTLTEEYYSGERHAFWGRAEGGAGDDTITAWTAMDAGLLLFDPEVSGGDGADLIRLSHAMATDAGAGDDLVVLGLKSDRSMIEEAPGSHDFGIPEDGLDPQINGAGYLTLGSGADQVFLTGFQDQPLSSDIGFLPSVLVDFDPAQDSLGLIVPEADRADYTVSLVTNAASGFLELHLRAELAPSVVFVKSVLLNGVTTGLAPGAIQFFNDEAAARSGLPYASL